MSRHLLTGTRIVEYGDELVEYTGLTLAGMGAEVIKVEPPQGSPTRRFGPYRGDVGDPAGSLHFWHHNRGKKSICLDLDDAVDQRRFRDLVGACDVVLRSREAEQEQHAHLWRDVDTLVDGGLVVAEMSPFGATGPWARYKASDLVQLALGGQVMCCGYDPLPDGTYDLPPVAPQMWHSVHIAGEQLTVGVLAALFHRARSGRGQLISCSVHEAAAKNVELAATSWIYRRTPLFRMTCRHAGERVTDTQTILQTKDGRWCGLNFVGEMNFDAVRRFLEQRGMAADLKPDSAGGASAPGPAGRTASSPGRPVPGTSRQSERTAHATELMQRLFRRHTIDNAPWEALQRMGIMCAPLRLPHENLFDPHWHKRRTFAQVPHPRLQKSFTYVTGKWLSDRTEWCCDRPPPDLDEHRHEVLEQTSRARARAPARAGPAGPPAGGKAASSWALEGIRVLDFTWFLASAGGTRFLSALGAECIKVEWWEHPDTRLAVMAPEGGRAAREAATAPLTGVSDPDMGGQFNNKNAGKRGISLNLADPRGLELARRLVAISDVVAEGFSPGVMKRRGLGYADLQAIRPGIIYASQSGSGSSAPHGVRRAVGPIAQALSGLSEQSGLPSPATPAGWGYSYLDWIGAYSFASAILGALCYRDRTGNGQWIDASQIETGIFLTGVSILDWSANRRPYRRTGNRAWHVEAAPHGIYPCAGADRWIAITCLTESDWERLVRYAGRDEWLTDSRWRGAGDRVAHEDELDRVIGEWTSTRDRYELMHGLQAAGVPAGVCQTGEDLCENDPQLVHEAWLSEVSGTKIGRWPVAEIPFHMSETPPFVGGQIARGAPCYGEDNEYVFGELLGLSTTEMQDLRSDNVI